MPIHLGQLPSVQLPMTKLPRLNRKLHDLLRKCNKCMDKLRDNALHRHPLRGHKSTDLLTEATAQAGFRPAHMLAAAHRTWS
jgi:hypothetical protein